MSVTSDDIPDETQAGSQVTTSVTFEELYRGPQPESQAPAGQTDLEDVTWIAAYCDRTGVRVNQQSFDGQNFNGVQIITADGTSEMGVTITGIAPEVESLGHDSAQTFAIISLDQTREGGSSSDIGSWSVHHYTEGSAVAWDELDSARDATERAGGANAQQAEQTFTSTVEAFNGRGFSPTANLTDKAETSANQVRQSSQTTQLLTYTAGGLLIVAFIVGGFFYRRSQQMTYDKLGRSSVRIVVPSGGRDPKTRLTPFSDTDERHEFAVSMLRNMLDTVHTVGGDPAVVVDALMTVDAPIVVDNRPLIEVVGGELGGLGGGPVAIIIADLVLATPVALSRLFEAGTDVVTAPGLGGGTNALVIHYPEFSVDYHGVSILDHRRIARDAGCSFAEVDPMRLAVDVDGPSGLVKVLAHGEGRAHEWLVSAGVRLARGFGRVGAARERRQDLNSPR